MTLSVWLLGGWLPVILQGPSALFTSLLEIMTRSNSFFKDWFYIPDEEGSRKDLEIDGFIGQKKSSEPLSPADHL